MGNLVMFMHLSLDGTMQAPGRADEDPRDGFRHGGWAAPAMQATDDPVLGAAIAEAMASAGPLLFGRRTYEDFYAVWPNRTDNPFTEILGRTQKYVVSRTLREPLPWQRSTLLGGDVGQAVARLKRESAGDTVVLGSGKLVRWLIGRDLVDRYILLIHPLLLGAGRRLFPAEGPCRRLRLLDARTTRTGVVITTYGPDRPTGRAEAHPQ